MAKNKDTLRLSAQEQRLLSAIAREVEVLQGLGHSDESIGIVVDMALRHGSVGITEALGGWTCTNLTVLP